jgi:hypothetical protein
MKGALKMTVKRAKAGQTENSDEEVMNQQQEPPKAPEVKIQIE